MLSIASLRNCGRAALKSQSLLKLGPQRFASTLGSSLSKRQSDECDAVVIGGGAVGASIAYHLAKREVKDVVLLEKSELTAGSTWHAAGLATYFHPGINLKRIHWDSINLFNVLEAETGQDVGFHKPGSLRLATTPERVNEIYYHMSRHGWNKAPQWIVSPEEIKELCPIINIDSVLAGLYNPNDGHIDPYSLTQALAIGARQYGAEIYVNTPVTDLKQRPDKRWEVHTDQGMLVAKHIINAAGFYGRKIGQMVGLDLPLVAIHHQYCVTGSIPEFKDFKREIPVMRDLEGSYYFRQEKDALVVGPYEAPHKMVVCKDWYDKGVPPDFGKELFESDIDRIVDHYNIAMSRFPAFANADIQRLISGPITFAPENIPLIGPVSELRNYWNAVGFGYGIIHSGGAGRYLADWIVDGEPPYDLMETDGARFDSWATRDYLFDKVSESYGLNNMIMYPKEERPAGRPTSRVSGLYSSLSNHGAVYGFRSGWEVPNWFCLPGDVPGYIPSYKRTNWFGPVGRECNFVLNKAGLYDLSSYGKVTVKGKDAAKFISKVLANKLPEVGQVNVSHMITPKGRVYGEYEVLRLEEDNFFLTCGAAAEKHHLRWLIENSAEYDVEINNVTEEWNCLAISGPKSREILAKATGSSNFSEANFPNHTCQMVLINGVEVGAVAMSFTGQFGWEFYVRSSDMEALHNNLWEAGSEFDIGHVGSYALSNLRVKAGIRALGLEFSVNTNPIEAGLEKYIDFTKPFIGKEAVLAEKLKEASRQLVFLNVDTFDVDAEGNESIWVNDAVQGYTTSGGFDYEAKKGIAFAYLPPHLVKEAGQSLQVDLIGRKYNAKIVADPLHS
ncbi:Dimethylglycine dehydrogenase, mitochondrial [Trichoplax sp. H2]|nr:Dimethylglycine dehydrogenase, mitochondrial [Trichoplax sp. H2]|eukprot:RDD45141.1 Dimethylglycine dehydrogenase, mitochondrial [Trichoplax sp. H2]